MKITTIQKQHVAVVDELLLFSELFTGVAITVCLIVYFSLLSYTSASLTATQMDLMIPIKSKIIAKAIINVAGVLIPYIAYTIK